MKIVIVIEDKKSSASMALAIAPEKQISIDITGIETADEAQMAIELERSIRSIINGNKTAATASKFEKEGTKIGFIVGKNIELVKAGAILNENCPLDENDFEDLETEYNIGVEILKDYGIGAVRSYRYRVEEHRLKANMPKPVGCTKCD